MRLALAHRRAGALHHQPHDPALDALAVVGLRRGVGLGHQHVAVGQHIEPARMVEANPASRMEGVRVRMGLLQSDVWHDGDSAMTMRGWHPEANWSDLKD
jgi:hypothetical protein